MYLQLYRIIRRLDHLGIDQPILLPDLIHRLHNHHTLLMRHALTLQLPIPQTSPALVRFPEHPLPRNLALMLLDMRPLLLRPLIMPIRPALRPLLVNDAVTRGSVRGPIDLNLALGALDADGGFGGVVAVDVGGDAEVGQGDAVRWVRGGVGAAGAAREGQDDGRVFVDARAGVFGDGGGDGGGVAGGGWDGVVEGLETPGYGVDAH